MNGFPASTCGGLAVVPVLIGPLQALLAVLWYVLPALAIAIVSTVVSLLRPRAMRALVRTLWRLKVQVALIAAVVASGVWGAGRLWPEGRSGAAGTAAATDGGNWPIFRGGLARRGAADGAKGPTAGRINWARQAGEEWFYSSPAVVGNRVYVASAMLTAFDSKNGTGRLYCFDAETGGRVWAAEPEFDTGHASYRATFSSPVVRGEYVVCGEGLHFAEAARVVCLDAATGRLRWSFQTASHVECTPVIADVDVGGRTEARVFVGAGDDGYYCLDLKTGRVRWHLPGAKYPDAETALTVHEGTVYAGLGNGGKAICAIDAATGAELARVPTPHAVFSPPAIADGALYVGMGTGDFVQRGSPPAGEVWRVDLQRLRAHKGGPFEPDWRIELEGTVLGAVTVAGKRLYFGANDGRVYAADRRTGKVLARFEAHAPVCASPAVAGRCVYAITEAGMLYGLDRRTLSCVWEYRVGTAERCISSPAVAGGRVYVGTQEDGFVCVGEPGVPARPVWAGRLGGAEVGGNPSGSPLPRLGEFEWQFPADQEGESNAVVVAAPPAILGQALLVPLTAAPGPGLACLPCASGPRKTPAPTWLLKTPHGVHVSPAAVGDRAFCVDGKGGDPNRRLRCVGLDDGTERWSAPVQPAAAGTFSATARDLLLCDGPRGMSAYGPDGKRQWSRPLGGQVAHAPAAAQSMVVAATADPPQLIALDRPTGVELWRVGLPAAPVASPWVSKTRVFVPTARYVEARSLIDGAPLYPRGWRRLGGGVSGEVVADPARVAFINTRGELVLLDRHRGEADRPPVPGARVGTTPLLGYGGLLYEAADGRIMKLPFSDGAGGDDTDPPKPTEWFDASWLGRPTTPMVLRGSTVYVGRQGWGLVRLGEAP